MYYIYNYSEYLKEDLINKIVFLSCLLTCMACIPLLFMRIEIMAPVGRVLSSWVYLASKSHRTSPAHCFDVLVTKNK